MTVIPPVIVGNAKKGVGTSTNEDTDDPAVIVRSGMPRYLYSTEILSHGKLETQRLLSSGDERKDLIEVFLGRGYGFEDATMRLWCSRNLKGYWSPGSPGTEILQFKLKEVPWLFELQEDAMIFMLRWQ